MSSKKCKQSKRPRRSKQRSFLPPTDDVLGGGYLRRGTNAKRGRPLGSRLPLHVCLRSRLATGKRSMLGRNKVLVDTLVRDISKRFFIKIQRYQNVGNHLHLVVGLPGRGEIARAHYRRWIKTLTARLAREVGGARRGKPLVDERGKELRALSLKRDGGELHGSAVRARFWDSVPFTRIVRGRSGWKVISRYMLKNGFEAQGWPKEVAQVMARDFEESHAVNTLPRWDAG